MTKINRSYMLVKYAEGCYMGQEHQSLESAIEHIESLKSSNDPNYSERKYTIVHIIETHNEIEIHLKFLQA